MNEVDGFPAVYWTVRRVLEFVPDGRVVVAAPMFDREGQLGKVFESLGSHRVSIYYGHDASPLNRFLDALSDYPDATWLIRVDGLSCFFDVENAVRMWEQSRLSGLDCMKFPDNFPPALGADVYRLGALRKARDMLKEGVADAEIFHVHPKFFLFRQVAHFRCCYETRIPAYPHEHLLACRAKAKNVWHIGDEVRSERRQTGGDSLLFRYEFMARHLRADMRVLDIACGTGYGTELLAGRVREVHGADRDEVTIGGLQTNSLKPMNAHYQVEDALCLSYPDHTFDAAVTIETIEHVKPQGFLRELHRVLRRGGILALSTPQNCMGAVPMNNEHLREFSLDEIRQMCSQDFDIVKIVGQKGGRICFEDDPIGATTLLIAKAR